MFSRLLVKLIDQAIVPAVLILVTRVVSIVLVASYFGIPYSIENVGFVYNSVEDFIVVNSYSVLIMVLVVTLGLLYILVKSLLFHETHISPQLTARLFMVRLSYFIQSSFDLYSQASVWLSYSYLLLFVSVLMSVFGLVYSWVFFTSLFFTLLASVVFILDVENEFETKKVIPNNGEFEEVEEVILNFNNRH